MAQLTLMIMSAILIVAVVVHGRSQRNGFDMLGAYFMMVMLYFGVYSLIDAVINEADAKDATLVVLTFALIFSAMLATWILYRMLPLRFRRVLRFDNLTENWASVDLRVIAFMVTVFFVFNGYLFFEFGMLTYVGAELDFLNISVPTWVGPAKDLMNAIGFSCYVSIVAAIIKGRIKVFSLFGILLLILALVLVLEGRRAFIELFLFAFVLWVSFRRENVYSFRYAPHAIALLAAFILISNIYQTYRREVLSIQSRIDGGDVTSLIDAAGNLDATIYNYRERLAMWNFNYMITAEQVESPTKLYYGEMAWQSLLNSIPAFLIDSKTVIDGDEMTAKLYGFEVTDYPTNDFASYLTDFGCLMTVLQPIKIVLILTLVSFSYFFTKNNNAIFLIVSAFSLQNIIKIENAYGDIFILIRNILLLSALMFSANVLRLTYNRLVPRRPVNQ